MNHTFSVTYYCALVVFLCSSSLSAHETHSTISAMRDRINNRFIQLPTEGIRHMLHRYFWHDDHERTMPEKFDEFLADKETVHVLEKIVEIAKEGTTGTALDALNMQKNINDDFKLKQDSLFTSYACYSWEQILVPLIMAGLEFCVLVQIDKSRSLSREQKFNYGMASGLASAVTTIGLEAYFSKKKGLIQNQINDLYTMKNSWNNTFNKAQNKAKKHHHC